MTTVTWTGRRIAGVAIAVLLSAWAVGASAQTGATLEATAFFGGAGSQRGTAVALEGTLVYVAGWDQPAGGPHGLLLRYDLPLLTKQWSATMANSQLNGVAATSTNVYTVGAAAPGTCSPSSGTVRRAVLARFTPAGSFLNCTSPDFFPFDGQEAYAAAADSSFVYAGGRAEQKNDSFPFVLVKYDVDGTLLKQVTEPGVVLGSFGCCLGESSAEGLAASSGQIYVAGFSRLVGFPFLEDNFQRPVLMRYDSELNRIWKVRSADLVGTYRAVALGADGFIYAVGSAELEGNEEFLAAKYDDSGSLMWSVTSGGPADDVLTGVVVIGSRLFAVGHTRSSGAGGADAVLLELDSTTGATRWSKLFGGALDDLANGVATDGIHLFVAGESKSFTAGGNGAGENDGMLLRYNVPPIADAGPDQTVPAGAGCTAQVTLDGTGSSDTDPAGALTYTWKGDFGTAGGATPTVTLGSGAHEIMLTVADAEGATDVDDVQVTVADGGPPVITSVEPNPQVLWPPNHQTVPVTVNVTASDACGGSAPACRIVAVSSNEPSNGRGDGNTAPDWRITGALTVDLRAERAGSGNGRVYTITVQCDDAAGNGVSATTQVLVPKSQRGHASSN